MINSFELEGLESRTFLSVNWGFQARQIEQDLAVADYPRITGAGQTIAMIDAGFDWRHPALGGGIGRRYKILAAHDFVDNDADPFSDAELHGTATTGLAAGNPYTTDGEWFQGIAPAARVVALRADTRATVSQALDWVLANRKVYNIVAVNLMPARSGTHYPQVDELRRFNVFVGSPSGNRGAGVDTLATGQVFAGSVESDGTLSTFSQRGPNVPFVAPGGSGTAFPWYVSGQHIVGRYSGTSWASPQVVGAAVLIHQINPRFTVDQEVAILRDSGTPIYDSVSHRTYTLLNVDAALRLAYRRSAAMGKNV